MRLFFWRSTQKSQDHSITTAKRWAWLGGRRMLAGAPYVMPKDKLEGDRLDLQHHLLKIAAGANYRAPLRQPRKILDVACGTGIWAREMALQFKRAEVIGFDIDRTPMERALEILGPHGQFPPNFRFIDANMFERFPFDDGEFDYTFARFLVVAVPQQQWPHITSEMVRVTKPGGYVEMVDLERFPVTQSPSYNKVLAAAEALVRSRGMEPGVGESLTRYLSNAGLPRIQVRKFEVGAGSRQQRLLISDLLAGHRNLKGAMVKLGYFTQEQFDHLMEGEEQELPQYGVTMPVVYTFGIKL